MIGNTFALASVLAATLAVIPGMAVDEKTTSEETAQWIMGNNFIGSKVAAFFYHCCPRRDRPVAWSAENTGLGGHQWTIWVEVSGLNCRGLSKSYQSDVPPGNSANLNWKSPVLKRRIRDEKEPA